MGSTHGSKDVLVTSIEAALAEKLVARHPAFLSPYVRCVDQKTGEAFQFEMGDGSARHPALDCVTNPVDIVDDSSFGWAWQRDLLNWWIENDWTIVLKGRQLGVTWVACLYALHRMLYFPGSSTLAYSMNEDEAALLVGRVWDMFESLPEHLKSHIKVLKPARGHRPYTEIILQHPDGRISTMTGMASTERSGRSRSAGLVILDEFAFQQYAQGTWGAVIPVMADGGKVIVISTANGVSNELTGGGNFYHHLWVKAGDGGYTVLKKKFLRWDLHPGRNQLWRDNLAMPDDQKEEEYPNTPEDAFLLSGRPYFDRVSLRWYADNATRRMPLYRGHFIEREDRLPRYAFWHDYEPQGMFEPSEHGCIRIYEDPVKDGVVDGVITSAHRYAIAADIATGRGLDYTVGAVIDLEDGSPVAELHGKLDSDQAAKQLHYLGRYYNDALIGVENQGGYGSAEIIFLRDGRHGRPPYKKLYRHKEFDKTGAKIRDQYGYPVNAKTRELLVQNMAEWMRDQLFPFIPLGLLEEAQTFVHRDKNPSPAALDGCNDDRVMAWAGACELFRQRGDIPETVKRRPRKKAKRRRLPKYPWE